MYQMNTQHKEQDDYSKLASSVAPSIAEEVTSPSIDETLADNPIIDNPIDLSRCKLKMTKSILGYIFPIPT